MKMKVRWRGHARAGAGTGGLAGGRGGAGAGAGAGAGTLEVSSGWGWGSYINRKPHTQIVRVPFPLSSAESRDMVHIESSISISLSFCKEAGRLVQKVVKWPSAHTVSLSVNPI